MPRRGPGPSDSDDATPRPPPVSCRAWALCLPGHLEERELDALGDALPRAGLRAAGRLRLPAERLPAAVARAGPEAWILVCFSYLLVRDIARDRRLWARIIRLLRRHHGAVVLPEDDLAALAGRSADCAALLAAARRGDRNLDLEPGEVFVRDLSESRMRASVWLVEKDGRRLVRKSFSRAYGAFLGRELQARQVLKSPVVLPIVARDEGVIWVPFLDGWQRWQGGALAFFPRAVALRVFDFLEVVNRAGYSMVDINPDAFFWNDAGEIRAIDFEFFAATRPAASFADSADFRADFPGIEAPRKAGYDRFWRDAVGASFGTVRRSTPAGLSVRRALHLLVRLPRRAARACEAAARGAIDWAIVGRRLRGGRLFVSPTRASEKS